MRRRCDDPESGPEVGSYMELDNIHPTRVPACSAMRLVLASSLSLSLSILLVRAEDRSVSMTFARMAGSGRESPRRRRGMSCRSRIEFVNMEQNGAGNKRTTGISCIYMAFGIVLIKDVRPTR